MTTDGPGAEQRAVGLHQELAELERQISDLRVAASDEGLVQALESAHEELRVADEEVRTQQAEISRLLASQRAGCSQRDRFIAALPAPVVVTDDRGLIRSANASAAAALGLPVDRLAGKPLLMFVVREERALLRRRLVLALGKDEVVQEAVTLAPIRGGYLRGELVGTATGDWAGGAPEVTWVLLPRRSPAGSTPGAPVVSAVVELIQLSLLAGDRRSGVEHAAAVISRALSVAAVSITVGQPAEPELVATTSSLAQRVDGAQVMTGEGPGQTAWEERLTLRVGDLLQEGRWPRFAAKSEGCGVRSVLAVPLEAMERRVGVLQAYSGHLHVFDDDSTGDRRAAGCGRRRLPSGDRDPRRARAARAAPRHRPGVPRDDRPGQGHRHGAAGL